MVESNMVGFVFLVGLCMSYGPVFAIQEHSKLATNLFQNYDKLARPANTAETPSNVTISFQLRYINGYDDKNGILSVYGWLKMLWTDPRLRWESFSYGGISQLQVPYSQIWIPDLIMVNSIDPAVPSLPSSSIQSLVYSNGTIFFTIPSVFRSPCTSSRRLSTVSCHFKFTSWMHDGYEINLTKSNRNTVDLSEISHNPSVKILSTNARRRVNRYPCCPEEIHYVDFTIDIEPEGAESSGSDVGHAPKHLILLTALSLAISI